MYFRSSDALHNKIHHEFKNNFWKKNYYIKYAHKLNFITVVETLNCERKVPLLLYGGIIIDSKSIY